MGEGFEKFNFKKQSPGYTPLHTSGSDSNPHTTWRGNEHTAHVYGNDFPWPIGKTEDKWLSSSVIKRPMVRKSPY